MYVAPQLPPIEVLPLDISGLRQGNVGIEYVHRFESAHPGPSVMINALTHGNEFCGMTALAWLFEKGVRLSRGSLTLSFANVAAYETFDPAKPLASRFVDRDFNRVWSREILDSADNSVEVRRARELRKFVETADGFFDIHSTTFPVRPMLIYKLLEKSVQLAATIREPLTHIVSTGGKHEGGVMYEFGRLGRLDNPAIGILVECGQHFAASSGKVAIQTMLRFLKPFDVIDKEFIAAHLEPDVPGAFVVYEISEVLKAKTNEASFVRPVQGFEEFQEGDVIGFDGEQDIRAPFDRCAIIMPKAQLIAGREMVTLARRLDSRVNS